MPSAVVSDLSRHAVLTYIVDTFGVDLHDYLVTPQHPLHQCAIVAENIARAALAARSQPVAMADRVKNILSSVDRERSVAAAFLNDMSFLDGKYHGYAEAVRMAIRPLLPQPKT